MVYGWGMDWDRVVPLPVVAYLLLVVAKGTTKMVYVCPWLQICLALLLRRIVSVDFHPPH